MCQIFYLPPGVQLDPAVAESERLENPDGWGVMLATGQELRWAYGKGKRQLAGAVDRLNSQLVRGLPRALHLRAVSRGKRNLMNQHPFLLRGAKLGLMHNGTVERQKFTDGAGEHSDTALVAGWLDRLVPEVETEERLMEVAADLLPLVCHNSRWMMMSRTGTVLRLGQWQWQEELGLWTSQFLSRGWEERKIKWDRWEVKG